MMQGAAFCWPGLTLLTLLRGPGDHLELPLPKGYVCYRALGPIQVDGRLDEPSWVQVPWTDPFVDIEGDKKPLPRYRTRAKMLWDDRYFYIGAELEEPHLWATLTEHDSVIFQDNDFEVFIDPDGDNHEYYEIEINALNTEWDLRLVKPYKDGGPALNEWEIPGLKTAVYLEGTLNDPSDVDRFWSVELAFPWEVLGEYARRPVPPAHGDQWRLNFSRVEWDIEIVDGRYRKVPDRPENNWVWSPQGVIDMHRPERWGYVQFSTAPVGQDEFRPDPAGPARQLLHRIYYAQRAYHEEHHRWADSLEELGLTGPWPESLAAPPSLRITPDGYQATAVVKLPDGSTRPWHIRQDARVESP